MTTSATHPLRLLFVLPGLHRVNRGAEAAFESLARELSALGQDVTLIGSGPKRPRQPYVYFHAGSRHRDKFAGWPMVPPLRSSYRWEELSFCPALWRAYRPERYDLTFSCSYPFVNWLLRLKKGRGGRRPPHIFVTENGDWPAQRRNSEYRLFGCDGLICTNPEYYQRHRQQWRAALIPNGVDTGRFQPAGDTLRRHLELPSGVPVVLMVSALIPSKRVPVGIEAVARLPEARLLLAGDGPERAACDALGKSLLGRRYRRLTLPPEQMPALYRSASILLHLSREEAFGNIYIEAAACGLPVVAHDYPTPRWILGECGSYVDTADPRALDQALLRALGQSRGVVAGPSPQLRLENMRARFSWSAVAEAYLDFSRQLLASGAEEEWPPR